MLSRAAFAPRVCFANRLTSSILCTRTTLHLLSLHGREERIQRRCYSSDPVIHSKEKIEALISGRISASEFKKLSKKTSQKASSKKKPWDRRKGRGGKRRAEDEEIPDWGLATAPYETNFAEELETVRISEEEHVEELSEPQEELAEKLANEPAVESIRPEQTTAQDGSAVEETVATELDHAKPKRELDSRQTFRDDLVQSRSVRVAALGEHIDAIMLKNPNEMKRPKRPVRRIQEETPKTQVELDAERASMLEQKEENDEETMAAALKNIDDLRPVDTTILRMEDFDSLANVLLSGFTFNQLAQYFNQKRLEGHNRDAEKPSAYPWIVKHGPWVAAKPDHWGALRPKQRQVIMIMQIIWNIEVREQVEGLGRSLVWLQPRIFPLIASPNNFVLDQIASEFLYESNKEKITSSFDDCRINIYAQKSTIPVILSRLDEIVQSIRHQKISADHIPKHDLDEHVLRELERITKTHIEYNKDNHELEISWLENKDPTLPTQGAKNTETPADIALRLLLEPPSKNPESSVHIITPAENNKGKDGAFIDYQRERRSMSWKDKLGQWSRYVVPIGQTAAQEDDISAQFLDAVSLPASDADADAKKTNDLVRQVSASFGHVLHSKNTKTLAAAEKHRRLLSPVLPHPASFTSIMKEDQPVEQRVTLVLNFSPDPKKYPTDSDARPPAIQLQLPVDPDTDLADFSLPPDARLFGVADHHVSDVLLPSESVDIRLTQQHLLLLDAGQDSVKEFLSSSEFNLPQGILKTPSKATFAIPKAWTTTPKQKTTRKSSKTSKAVVDAPYLFMGLEIHQAVELAFHGHTLRYSSIDAGRHGGHRQELSLQAGPPQGERRESVALDKAEESRFLSLAEGIATGKYFSWHDGAQLMREMSDESPGFDALEDEAGDEQLLLREDEYPESKPLSALEREDLSTEPGSASPVASDSTTDEASEDSGSAKASETKDS